MSKQKKGYANIDELIDYIDINSYTMLPEILGNYEELQEINIEDIKVLYYYWIDDECTIHDSVNLDSYYGFVDTYDDDAEEVEESQQELYTITVNGEQVDVTLDELRQGYQRQKDYTQKTQAIAEARKQNQQLVNQYSQKLNELDNIAQYLEANPDIPEPQIDWQKLYESDPVEWSVQRQLYNERERVRQNRAAQINLVKEEQQSLAQQQFAGHLQEQRERLLELVPEWKDKQVAAVEKREIRDFAISQFGMNQQDVDNAFDAKLVAMLRSAYLYHKGADKAQKVTKPVAEKAVRTQGRRNRPDTPRTDLKKAQERLQKTGSVEDAAAVFEKMFG